MDDGTNDAAERPYSAKHLLHTLDISRSSLLYYERIGLISPGRVDENGYRTYADADVFRIFAYIVMRTVGYAANEAVERIDERGCFLDRDLVDECVRKVSQRMAYDALLLAALERLVEARRAFDERPLLPIPCDIPRFLFFRDHAEAGYDRFGGEAALAELVRHLPIVSLGAHYGAYPPRRDSSCLWGRVLPEECLAVVPVDPEAAQVLGGVPGLRIHLELPVHATHSVNSRVVAALDAHMEREGLRPGAPPFVANAYPVNEDALFATLYVPTEPLDGSAREGVADDGVDSA